MNPILALVLEYAAKYGPEIVTAVEGIVRDIQADHPTLGGAPPADEEQSIDTAIDKVVDTFPRTDPSSLGPGGDDLK